MSIFDNNKEFCVCVILPRLLRILVPYEHIPKDTEYFEFILFLRVSSFVTCFLSGDHIIFVFMSPLPETSDMITSKMRRNCVFFVTNFCQQLSRFRMINNDRATAFGCFTANKGLQSYFFHALEYNWSGNAVNNSQLFSNYFLIFFFCFFLHYMFVCINIIPFISGCIYLSIKISSAGGLLNIVW